MGAHFSCKAYETDVITLNKIRVVHLDGSLENYEHPTTVDQVTSNFPKHFLCIPVEVLQSGLIPLRLNHQLISGQIYFMLPNSTLQFNMSPIELVSLTRKLMHRAKTGKCSTKLVATTRPGNPICNQQAEQKKLSPLKKKKNNPYVDSIFSGLALNVGEWGMVGSQAVALVLSNGSVQGNTSMEFRFSSGGMKFNKAWQEGTNGAPSIHELNQANRNYVSSMDFSTGSNAIGGADGGTCHQQIYRNSVLWRLPAPTTEKTQLELKK